jgi:hypothetical protein
MMTLTMRRALQILLGAVAGLFAWPLMESLIRAQSAFPDYLAFTVASGAVFGIVYGAALGSADGIVSARGRRILSGALWGALAGIFGGAVGFLVGQGVLFVLGEYLSGALVFPLARAPSWAVLGIFVGTASGIRSASARKCGIGALGGLLGGLVGGALIEFGLFFYPRSSAARAVGLIAFGGLVGLAFAVVERRLSFGVLRVLNGRLKGREYLLNQRRTRIGEDPRCDVPVAGYRGLTPLHASVVRRGRDLVLEPDAGPVQVNDERVKAEAVPLKYDDVIACGGVRFLLRRE